MVQTEERMKRVVESCLPKEFEYTETPGRGVGVYFFLAWVNGVPFANVQIELGFGGGLTVAVVVNRAEEHGRHLLCNPKEKGSHEFWTPVKDSAMAELTVFFDQQLKAKLARHVVCGGLETHA